MQQYLGSAPAKARRFRGLLVWLFAFWLCPMSVVAEQMPSFEGWLAALRKEARVNGISEATLDAALSDLRPIERVIELDRSQPELTLTLQEYLNRVVPRRRVDMGRKKLAANRRLLEEIGATYGVQPRFIVALWGVETDFGRLTGGFSVIGALATLAYDGRRSAYFREELLDALHIIEDGHVEPQRMTGSWAGAMGQAQFMPSTFRGYATDHDGDARIDLWHNRGDVFASAARYLSKSGWKGDQTWGRPVELPSDLDRGLIGLDTKKSLSQWQALGVRRANGANLPVAKLSASLIQPDGAGTQAYLVYSNFETLLKWNRSHSFAIAVGTLADRIVGRH